MVIEYVRFRVPFGAQPSFLDAYSEACEVLSKSPYCLSYELSQCQEEPLLFVLRVEWTSTRDHVGRFRFSSEFRKLIPVIRPYFDNIEETYHYRPTNLTSGRQPVFPAVNMN